jgi:hypothetical protein
MHQPLATDEQKMKFVRVVVIGAAIVVVASYVFTGLSHCLRSLVRGAKPVATEAAASW